MIIEKIEKVERYGIVNELPLGRKHGVLVGIANFTFRLADGSTFDDAALFMARRSFGLGRMNITLLRKQAWQFQDDATLIDGIARQAAKQLFCSETPEDLKKIADIVEYAIDDLVMHPPEDVIDEQKRQQKELERLGLVIKANDKIVLDAS